LLNNGRPNPQYAGERWSVKNLFELKWAYRVLLEGNIFENTCGGNQDGTAFLVNAGMPGGVTDLLAVSNTIRYACHMFSINTHDRNNAIPARLAFRNNLGLEISRRFCLLLHRNTDIAFEHNTVVPQTPAGLSDSQAVCIVPDQAGFFPRQTFKRNVFGNPRYGIFTQGGSLDTLLPDRVWLENAEYGQTGTPPSGVKYYSTSAAAGINTATGALASNSPLKAGRVGYFGTDRKDIGVDFAVLEAAQTGATAPDPGASPDSGASSDPGPALEVKFQAGDRVRVVSGTHNVRTAPNSTLPVLDPIPQDSTGTITDGPTVDQAGGSNVYYEVQWDSAGNQSGWMVQVWLTSTRTR
jgi:hypothetical protein